MKKILVIEDEATQVLLLQAHLKQHGYNIAYSMNGEDGLVKATEELPDLILLDIILPGISGIDVCIALKDNPKTTKIPIILLTASKIKNLEERCRMFGVKGCLMKPYDMPELLEKIEAVLQAQ